MKGEDELPLSRFWTILHILSIVIILMQLSGVYVNHMIPKP